jgi:hypothetical protein
VGKPNGRSGACSRIAGVLVRAQEPVQRWRIRADARPRGDLCPNRKFLPWWCLMRRRWLLSGCVLTGPRRARTDAVARVKRRRHFKSRVIWKGSPVPSAPSRPSVEALRQAQSGPACDPRALPSVPWPSRHTLTLPLTVSECLCGGCCGWVWCHWLARGGGCCWAHDCGFSADLVPME